MLLSEAPLLGEPLAAGALELELGEAELPLELELEPDLLKYASHSEREIWPSLFLSTAEKVGWDALLGWDELPLVAEGEDEEDDALSPPATAIDERAKSTAAVVTVTSFI